MKTDPVKRGQRPSRERLAQIRAAHNTEPPDLHFEVNWSMEAMEDLFIEIDHLTLIHERPLRLFMKFLTSNWAARHARVDITNLGGIIDVNEEQQAELIEKYVEWINAGEPA